MFWTSSPILCIGMVRTKRKKAQITMRDNTWVGFLGRTLTEAELGEIDQIVDDCRKLSRTELAATVCELFSWKRPSGRLKTVECRQLLEYLDSEGLIELPGRGRRNLNTLEISPTNRTNPCPVLTGEVGDISQLSLKMVTTRSERQLWYEYVDRYHYLGYRRPFGAQLRYFVEAVGSEPGFLGCLQFSSAAWKMAPRDRWIEWDDETRRRNLQKIISNSRFLLLPWVRVKNLASFVLALALREVVKDWESMYGLRPVLVETLVDRERFRGTCYRAANWIYLGKTTGRGRMDRENKRVGLFPKDIYVYPLSSRFRRDLMA